MATIFLTLLLKDHPDYNQITKVRSFTKVEISISISVS